MITSRVFHSPSLNPRSLTKNGMKTHMPKEGVVLISRMIKLTPSLGFSKRILKVPAAPYGRRGRVPVP